MYETNIPKFFIIKSNDIPFILARPLGEDKYECSGFVDKKFISFPENSRDRFTVFIDEEDIACNVKNIEDQEIVERIRDHGIIVRDSHN